MKPKTEKRKSMNEQFAVSLSDPVNTDKWKCAVVLVLEAHQRDSPLTRIFAEEVSTRVRKEVKCIDFDIDIMKIVKSFVVGEIDSRYNFLLNFSAIFEEAAEYVKNAENIPVGVMVKIIRSLILMLRMENETERKEGMICQDNPIEIMAAKPLMPSYGTEVVEREDEKKYGKKKSIKNGVTGVKVKPPTPMKVDTKLLRRGEQPKDLTIIDDVPDNTYFQLYIALTGFHDPELAVKMIKSDIPLCSVICLNTSCTVQQTPSSITVDLEAFWNDFLQLLWRPDSIRHFQDVVFLVYSPEELPAEEKELRSFIFREISFLMYDLSDLRHQHACYLSHMRLWNVDEAPDRIALDTRALDELPYECVSIPLMVQNILDTICGEDEETESMDRPGSSTTRVSTIFTVSETGMAESKASFASFASLAPVTSSMMEIPDPRWSAIIDTDEKLFLYNKLLMLDKLYDIEDYYDLSERGTGSNMSVCKVKKKRLPCKNLDMEIETHSEGLLAKLWSNYPVWERGASTELSHLTSQLNYPDLTMNYILFLIWITRMEDNETEKHESVSINDSITDTETRFTVTDGSRLALHKMKRPPSFFSPSELRIIPSGMLKSVSAPQFHTPPAFSWSKKCFVSDDHIPRKYLEGAPLTVFDDLRNYVGDEAFSRMKDYDFIEEVNKNELKRIVQDANSKYDCIRHAYLPLTDCIYIVLYDNPTVNGLRTQVYNVMLRTPIGLRDFYDYILDEEREWLSEQDSEKMYGNTMDRCPNSLYNPTPDFRDFTEFDFWHEKSIKYTTYEGEIIESIMQGIASGEPDIAIKHTTGEKGETEGRVQTSVYATPGEPYRFVGFDMEPGAVQYSGVDTTFEGPDNCVVRVSLQERLYGMQQLGIHVQQGGHNLHLYSYVCPQPHLDQPYSCHVEYKNGAILAFARRMFPFGKLPLEGSNTTLSEMLEDELFAYDMKVSFPHGLTVTTVRNHMNPCYIRQSYRENGCQLMPNEKKRLFLKNGSIIKILTNNEVEVMIWDTTVVTASLDDLVMPPSQSESQMSREDLESSVEAGKSPHFQSYTKMSPDGCLSTVSNGKIIETLQYQILVRTEKEIQRTYYRRMDGVCHIMMDDGSVCTEFRDGSKICIYLQQEEVDLEEDPISVGEGRMDNIYTVVHMMIVMEHPDYASAIYDTRNCTWRMILPCKSEIEVDCEGCYQVLLDNQTKLDVTTTAIRMWRCNPRDKFVMSTEADLTVFGGDASKNYCTTMDSLGRKFTVESNGTCCVTENETWNDFASTMSFESESGERFPSREDPKEVFEPKRYFLVRRDLSGFEIIHMRDVKREIENAGLGAVVFCQKLKTTPVTRYFVLLKEAEQTDSNKWKVESITPNAVFSVQTPLTSSTYGVPPSWMHPFPKKKPKARKPGVLHGRIILETKPTDCPYPNMSHIFKIYDISDFPEPRSPSVPYDDYETIMKMVANQNQDLLKEMYYTAIHEAAQMVNVENVTSLKTEEYLLQSKYHVQLRECLKKCLVEKKVPSYFNYPPGMVWEIIQTIVDSIIIPADDETPEHPPITYDVASSTESSGIEYNLEWSTEPSYSDLSYRSNLSMKTAPELSKCPICQALLPSPREATSEPIYKMKEFLSLGDDLSFGGGMSLKVLYSHICTFNKEDIHILEKKTSSTEKEQEINGFVLEDLMNLGLV